MVAVQRESLGTNVQLEVVDEAPIRLPTEDLDQLYRIAQEAVSNARKHANADTITVKLAVLANAVRLEVVDDGAGLPSKASTPNGLGLKIMRYRTSLIGARLSIAAGDSCGTRLLCECAQ